MKCDICKDDFPDDELVEADIVTMTATFVKAPNLMCATCAAHSLLRWVSKIRAE